MTAGLKKIGPIAPNIGLRVRGIHYRLFKETQHTAGFSCSQFTPAPPKANPESGVCCKW